METNSRPGVWLNHELDQRLSTLKISSLSLKGNPWGDPLERYHYVYSPDLKQPLPVILYLPGFLGSAKKSFSFKGFEPNFFETLTSLEKSHQLPKAHIVCVDGWTSWGGSQYIDSAGMGNYESHIIRELLPALEKNYKTDGRFALVGGSSGGYGALSLLRTQKFACAAVMAPDCFFQASLLPDLYKALPYIQKAKGVSGVFQKLQTGELFKNRNYFSMLNAIAMGLCYAPDLKNPKEVEWPIDLENGELKPKAWQRWLNHDPIHFLKDAQLKKKSIFLTSGRFDEFNLQYGAEQLRELLVPKCDLEYSMFDGTHRDLSEQLPQVFSWLKEQMKD